MDESELLAEAIEAERAYDAAEREEAEAAYADFQLVLETGRDRLDEIRTAYAATLDESVAPEYESAFDRAATKRFPRFAAGL